jgi:predicted peptidase
VAQFPGAETGPARLAGRGGRFRRPFQRFDSAAAKSAVSYHIYTPEVHDAETERRFPVLYWLHGSGGGLTSVYRVIRDARLAAARA